MLAVELLLLVTDELAVVGNVFKVVFVYYHSDMRYSVYAGSNICKLFCKRTLCFHVGTGAFNNNQRHILTTGTHAQHIYIFVKSNKKGFIALCGGDGKRMLIPMKMSFSRQELKELAIAWGVLSVILSRLSIDMLPISFLAVGTAFVCHELAHKYVAVKNNYFAEFRIWREGLMLAILIAFISQGQFIFAAPGAVYIFGFSLSQEANGKISLAGPALNLVVATCSLLAFWVYGGALFAALATINGYLGFFNLMPVAPLDGGKIMAWNRQLYFGTVGWSFLLIMGIEYLVF